MLAPCIGQLVACLADKTYTIVHVLPLLLLVGFISVVKSLVNSCALSFKFIGSYKIALS